MRCELCGKNTRCSCKWGWCPWCNSTNKQVSFINDLLKFWVTKDLVKEKLNEFRAYTDKIDAYTAYEYITWEIDEEKFNEAIANYKSWYKPYVPKKRESEVKNFIPTPNPEKKCVFDSNSPWARCLKCNSVAKYMHWKDCPMYKWNEE
jgi:hypothetical protein